MGRTVNLYFRLMLVQWRSRFRRRLELTDTVRTPFRVAPTDLDVLGLIRTGFWAALRSRGWYPVVAGQTITYRRSLKLGQRFDLYTRMIGFDDRWGYVEQTFCVGTTIHAQAVVRTRILKRSGGSVDHDELEAMVGGFPASLVVPDPVRQWTASLRIAEPEYVPANEDR
jgi:hypothetical protein